MRPTLERRFIPIVRYPQGRPHRSTAQQVPTWQQLLVATSVCPPILPPEYYRSLPRALWFISSLSAAPCRRSSLHLAQASRQRTLRSYNTLLRRGGRSSPVGAMDDRLVGPPQEFGSFMALLNEDPPAQTTQHQRLGSLGALGPGERGGRALPCWGRRQQLPGGRKFKCVSWWTLGACLRLSWPSLQVAVMQLELPRLPVVACHPPVCDSNRPSEPGAAIS